MVSTMLVKPHWFSLYVNNGFHCIFIYIIFEYKKNIKAYNAVFITLLLEQWFFVNTARRRDVEESDVCAWRNGLSLTGGMSKSKVFCLLLQDIEQEP